MPPHLTLRAKGVGRRWRSGALQTPCAYGAGRNEAGVWSGRAGYGLAVGGRPCVAAAYGVGRRRCHGTINVCSACRAGRP